MLQFAEFSRRLQACSPEHLSNATLVALHTHYRLLLKWNERFSLVGPGTLADAIELHYGESLAALPLLSTTSRGTLVDIGSGAGFPGFVLAVARPALRAIFVEPRERKWAFLKRAASESGIAAECLLGDVDRAVPPGFPERAEWVTLRALKLPERAWEMVSSHLSNDGRVLVWAGREEPVIPREKLRVVRSVPLAGTRWKRILELVKL